jgi:phage-related protein (TIGR01555 family)
MRKVKQKKVADVVQQQPEQKRAMDAFANLLARTGFGTQNLMNGTEYPLVRLSQNYTLLNSLYRSHWIVRRVIDTIPEDMCKNGWRIKSQIQPEMIDRFEKLEKKTGTKAKLIEALKWGRLYGGAGAIMMIDGHEDILDQPLDYDIIMPGSYCGLLVRDRWSGISPSGDLVDNPRDIEFGLPKYYSVTTNDGTTFKVHHSRVLRFIGRDVPFWEKQAEVYWGVSEVEHIYEDLTKRDNTSNNIANLIFRAYIFTMKMNDLGQTLALGDSKAQKDLYNVVQAQNWLMSNQGMMIMDKGDELDTKSYTFAGLNDIYESFMLDISGAAEIPVTKLFGRSPAGMNATGEADENNYYDSISQKREASLSPALNKLIPVMALSEWGVLPDDLDYSYNPIGTLTNKDKAELADKSTTAIINTFNSGLISQKIGMKELRQQSDITGLFSNITDEDIERADDDLNNPGEDMPNFHEPSMSMSAVDGGAGSGNFNHSGRPGEIGGSGEGGSGSQAEKDCKLKNYSKEIQKKYDKSRRNEKEITPVMNEIASELGVKMYGLEYSVKTASSVEDKIQRNMKKGLTDQDAIDSMNDIVRYTQLCEHNKIAENTLKTVELLSEKGYDVTDIDNKYLDPNSDYKGVHINAFSPDGQSFELQIHSKQSMDVKNSIHSLYEESRNVKTNEERRKELRKIMKEISLKVPNPKGIESVKNYKKG